MQLRFMVFVYVLALYSYAELLSPTTIELVVGENNHISRGSVHLKAPISLETSAKVVPLVEGLMYPTERGYFMTGSITFIADQQYYIVVDSPSATDQVAKDQMFKGLNALGITPGQVHIAVTTHGHPDHFGQGNFFSNARHFFGPYEYEGGTFTRTELFNRNEIRLTQNVELWNTPGHTSKDTSLIVRNVEGYGTVAVVGDLFYSELDALSSSQNWEQDALDAKLGIENRRRVLCAADAIVPGHSKIFDVTSEMKIRSGCPQILSIASITNDVNTLRSDMPLAAEQHKAPAAKLMSEEIQPNLISLPLSLQQPKNTSALVQSRAYAMPALSNLPIPLPINAQKPNTVHGPPLSLTIQSQPVYSTVQQQPLLTAETIQSLQQSILLPFLESTATNLANYLTAAQGGIPIPQIAATQVRTNYPAIYPTMQTLSQQKVKTNRKR